ncbi:MAG: hypothetical protein V2I33_23560 [Kangiellaceae bacterium]|nr:hypothetical protein [Kangiellaceae bacterium]
MAWKAERAANKIAETTAADVSKKMNKLERTVSSKASLSAASESSASVTKRKTTSTMLNDSFGKGTAGISPIKRIDISNRKVRHHRSASKRSKQKKGSIRRCSSGAVKVGTPRF